MLTAIFLVGPLIALILIVWFRTEAWVEYCRLFRLDFISHYKDYDEKKKNDVSLTYHGYLKQYHNCFITRMVTCPICLAIWLSLLNILFISKWSMAFSWMPFVFLEGLALFLWMDRKLG